MKMKRAMLKPERKYFYISYQLTHKLMADKYAGMIEKDAEIDRLMKPFKAKELGSGSGFGYRDVDYEIDDSKVAEAKSVLEKAGYTVKSSTLS